MLSHTQGKNGKKGQCHHRKRRVPGTGRAARALSGSGRTHVPPRPFSTCSISNRLRAYTHDSTGFDWMCSKYAGRWSKIDDGNPYILPSIQPCSPRMRRSPLPRRWNWTNGWLVCAQKSARLLDLDCPVPQDASGGRLCGWGSEQKIRVNGCGRPSQTAIVLVTAKRLSGQLIRQ